MDFRAYQQEAKRTGGNDLLPENRDRAWNCAALGLCGEATKFADHVKSPSTTGWASTQTARRR